jgi:hypothetical protein
MKPRLERDPLGEVNVPADAYYGVQTTRAVENFPISGLTASPELVTATVLIKKAAAEANASLGRLAPDIADAIVRAADEVLKGSLRDQFVVDVYQAGAGTSHNMNTNEVLANRAAEILGAPRGNYDRVHPNDHVNMAQSTNDVFPTATRLAILFVLRDVLRSARALGNGLAAKSREFANVLKTGRTHLQDAVPITLGQEFAERGPCSRRSRTNGGAAARVEPRIHGCRHRHQRWRRLYGRGRSESCALHELAADTGDQPVPGYPEHGGRAGVLGCPSAPGGGSEQGRIRPAASEHGAEGRDFGDSTPGRAAGLVDHAWQSESVGP